MLVQKSKDVELQILREKLEAARGREANIVAKCRKSMDFVHRLANTYNNGLNDFLNTFKLFRAEHVLQRLKNVGLWGSRDLLSLSAFGWEDPNIGWGVLNLGGPSLMKVLFSSISNISDACLGSIGLGRLVCSWLKTKGIVHPSF